MDDIGIYLVLLAGVVCVLMALWNDQRATRKRRETMHRILRSPPAVREYRGFRYHSWQRDGQCYVKLHDPINEIKKFSNPAIARVTAEVAIDLWIIQHGEREET